MATQPYQSNPTYNPNLLPPGYGQYGELDTQRGLKYANWSFIVYFIVLIMMIIVQVMTYTMALSITGYTGSYSSMGYLIGILLLYVIIFAFAIVLIVFWILGLYHVNKGKNEFGEIHQKKVNLSLKLFILYLILTFVSILLTIVLVFSLILSITSYTTPQTITDTVMVWLIAIGIIGFVGALSLAFHLLMLVFELSDESHKRMLWMAFFLNLIGLTIGFTMSIAGTILATGLDPIILLLPMIPMIITLFVFILFYLCYRHAHHRISSGELRPVPRPPPQYGYPGAYPGYAQGYPPPPR